MSVATGGPDAPSDRAAVEFYRRTMALLAHHGIPFLVGGAFALSHYAGIERPTKDIDLFVTREDVDRVGAALAGSGYRLERTFPHWLAKVWHGDHFIDLVFGSANGIAGVDEEWFRHATRGHALATTVWLCPVEETIWSKAFTMERERVCGGTLISREQYLIDVDEWGFEDARLAPRGTLSPDDVRIWTRAIREQRPL